MRPNLFGFMSASSKTNLWSVFIQIQKYTRTCQCTMRVHICSFFLCSRTLLLLLHCTLWDPVNQQTHRTYLQPWMDIKWIFFIRKCYFLWCNVPHLYTCLFYVLLNMVFFSLTLLIVVGVVYCYSVFHFIWFYIFRAFQCTINCLPLEMCLILC